MSRPTHREQQQALDAATGVVRGGWFWQPDPAWLNAVNTTNYRTVNAIRAFVGATALWMVIEIAVVWTALTRCGFRHYGQLGAGETLSMAKRLCEESLATARLFDFAATLFDSYALLLAGMAGIAVAANAVKRATDTEHRVAVETAKAKAAPPTVVAQGQSTVEVTNEAKPTTAEQPAIPARPTGDARVDDER